MYAACFRGGDADGSTHAIARMPLLSADVEELSALASSMRREMRGTSGLSKLLLNYCDDRGDGGDRLANEPGARPPALKAELARVREAAQRARGVGGVQSAADAADDDGDELVSGTHGGEADRYGRRGSEVDDDDGDPYEERLAEVVRRLDELLAPLLTAPAEDDGDGRHTLGEGLADDLAVAVDVDGDGEADAVQAPRPSGVALALARAARENSGAAGSGGGGGGGAPAAGAGVVVLAERALAELPLEGLAALRGVGPVSRDFSAAFLSHRLRSLGCPGSGNATAPLVRDADMTFVVDPHDEDARFESRDADGDGDVEEARPAMREVFAQLVSADKLADKWKPCDDKAAIEGGGGGGVVGGVHHVPSDAEWQRMLRSRSGGGLLFLGPGRPLAHCAPSLLAGLALGGGEAGVGGGPAAKDGGCNLVLLVDRAENAASARRQAKLDNQKETLELALEVRRLARSRIAPPAPCLPARACACAHSLSTRPLAPPRSLTCSPHSLSLSLSPHFAWLDRAGSVGDGRADEPRRRERRSAEPVGGVAARQPPLRRGVPRGEGRRRRRRQRWRRRAGAAARWPAARGGGARRRTQRAERRQPLLARRPRARHRARRRGRGDARGRKGAVGEIRGWCRAAATAATAVAAAAR